VYPIFEEYTNPVGMADIVSPEFIPGPYSEQGYRTAFKLTYSNLVMIIPLRYSALYSAKLCGYFFSEDYSKVFYLPLSPLKESPV
jgi:hypothetical protein